jgi:colicin import membrane protein/protein TonB
VTTPAALAQSPLLVQRERLLPVVLLSLAVHLGLLGLAVFHRSAPRVDLGQKPIVAKLVRLGEKRPEQWLPRKEEAPPPAATAPEAAPVVAQPATPAPAAPAAPVAKPTKPAPPQPARAAGPRSPGRTDVLASVLNRVKRDQALSGPVYGDPHGDPLGDASEAGEGDQYLALVERALRQSYVLPSTLSERDRVSLAATVVLYLDQDGRVLRFAFEKPSGNGAFDAALERAIHAARLPPPPAELRKRYREDGLGVVYRP